jgi:8-oxo-dGTP pyrophosphatase MutT (NUDIX family)
MTSPYVTLSSRIAYANRWTRLREDRIRYGNSPESIYGVVERSDFVIVVACQDGHLTLVEQFRYPVGTRVWEFPMGSLEQEHGSDLAVTAAAELREETGLIAGRMVPAGAIFQGPGYCNQRGHVFLATDLTQGATAREATEQDMVCRRFSLAEFEAMVRDGTVCEAMTLSAFALLRIKGLL